MARRPTDWIDSDISAGVASGAQLLTTLLPGLAPEDFRGATVIRTIIALSFHSVTVAGAWGVQKVDLAIGIAAQEAFAAGVVPDPGVGTEKPSRGWLWRTSRSVGQNGVGTPVVDHLFADIRGSRKIENGEVYFVVDNLALVGTAFSVGVRGIIRLLIKI